MRISLIIIVAVIVLIYLFYLDRKLKEKTKCRICGGSGKMWEEAHDSADLQLTNCSYCKGTGLIC